MPSPDWDILVAKGNDSPSLKEYHSKASQPGSGGMHNIRECRTTEKDKNLQYDNLKKPARLAMTPEEQDAEIRQAIYNDDTMPKETDLQDAIGKIAHLVVPRKEALTHKAAPLIQSYATDGCPANCGPNWKQEHIEAAILKGPHSSATDPQALIALHEETAEKVKNGYATVVRYGDIKDKIPPKLKISPVAMIPHKSRDFRTILDLSFRLRYKGKLLESVNSATTMQAPAESMIQLGNCVTRLIAMLADNYDPKKHLNSQNSILKMVFGACE